MRPGKTSTLTLRIAPAFKEALRMAAEREHRSIANMIEVLIRDHCQSNGVPILEQQDLPLEDTESSPSNR